MNVACYCLMVLLPILCLEMVHLEPLPLPLPGNVPYYKKQGIEKFIDEDDRLRKHCKMLIDSGAEVENLEAECQRIYYKEEYEDNDDNAGLSIQEMSNMVTVITAVFVTQIILH